MTEKTIREGLNEAMEEELRRDERVVLYGEDVAEYGGLYQVTDGLKDEIGSERVFDTPLAETAIGGSGVGAALSGTRPIVEIMFADFLPIIADQIINYAAKMHFNYGDGTSVPLVIRTMYGGGDNFGLHHSQSPESWFVNVPGIKIVMPSTPYDYKGLLKSAVRDDDPVLFLEHKMRYDISGEIPDGEYTVPLCQSEIKRKGDDLTIVALGGMVDHAIVAAENLAKDGIECEVVDPRTLVPLDTQPIVESVKKTNALITVHEAPKFGGFGGEIVAQIADEALFYIDAPIKRVGAAFTPVPFAERLEQSYLPDESDIEEAVHTVLER